MLRVAALYDVHGNLPALDAALAAVEETRPDAIVLGGDHVLGPMPAETLELLRAIGERAHFISGNCDRLVVDAFDGRLSEKIPAPVREAILWTASRLDRAGRDFLAALPGTLTLPVDGLGDVLFCHATPRSDEEIVTRRTTPERLRPALAAVAQRVVVCGHTHMQYDRAVDGVRLLNAGSVGMPYGPPAAHWLLLAAEPRFERTGYDLARAAALVRATSYPRAEEFAAKSVLTPPSEEEMLTLFG